MSELKITCLQDDNDSLAFDSLGFGGENGRLIVGVIADDCSTDIFISAEDEEKLRVLLNERKESKR